MCHFFASPAALQPTKLGGCAQKSRHHHIWPSYFQQQKASAGESIAFFVQNETTHNGKFGIPA